MKSIKDIEQIIVDYLFNVNVYERFEYSLVISYKTWNKFTKLQKSQLTDIISTECRNKIHLSRYVDDNKLFLVKQNMFSSDTKIIDL